MPMANPPNTGRAARFEDLVPMASGPSPALQARTLSGVVMTDLRYGIEYEFDPKPCRALDELIQTLRSDSWPNQNLVNPTQDELRTIIGVLKRGRDELARQYNAWPGKQRDLEAVFTAMDRSIAAWGKVAEHERNKELAAIRSERASAPTVNKREDTPETSRLLKRSPNGTIFDGLLSTAAFGVAVFFAIKHPKWWLDWRGGVALSLTAAAFAAFALYPLVMRRHAPGAKRDSGYGAGVFGTFLGGAIGLMALWAALVPIFKK